MEAASKPRGGDPLADYITQDELCTLLNKHKTTVRRWRRLGEGPPVTLVGKSPYYHVDRVAEWLAGARTFETT